MSPLTCRYWVELRGFEPLTPSMRTRCATGLRYSPNNVVSLANSGACSRHRWRGGPMTAEDTRKDTVNAALREVGQRLTRLRALAELGEMADRGDFDEFHGGKSAYRR
jgi:hypothetical protein